ncbi:MAG TPA: hypothetical protein VGF76_10905 [Polyangiaceae bacterium]|jgi:hypothetical protein
MIRTFAAGCLVLVACSNGAGAPVRSPALDYEPPAPTTADGDTVGADQTGPGDKLHQGVSSAAPAPGWTTDNKQGVSYDPKRHTGGAIDPVPANGSSSK